MAWALASLPCVKLLERGAAPAAREEPRDPRGAEQQRRGMTGQGDDGEPGVLLVEDARVGEPRERAAVRPHWQSPPGS